MKRKICVVSGSRADYGLLQLIIAALRAAQDIELQLFSTWDCPEEVGYRLHEQSDDTPEGVTSAMGRMQASFGLSFKHIKPDLLILLGDRYEIFAAATAATIARIPIAHIHGGETTEGAFDEALRHSITKMSHLHFVAAELYRKRVIQLGEQPERVFTVGGLGADNIAAAPLMTREALEARLGIDIEYLSLLIVMHPETLSSDAAQGYLKNLITALDGVFVNVQRIFIGPNADPGNVRLRQIIAHNVRPQDAHLENLSPELYLALLSTVNGIVGNSSSALLEAPILRQASINIGSRQEGRLKAASVIDCDGSQDGILDALCLLYSPKFRESLASAINPYGEGGATEKIVKILREHPLDGIVKKKFYDL